MLVDVSRSEPDILVSTFYFVFNKRTPFAWAYGVVVSMFDFHRSDRGSNPGRGGTIL